MNLLAAKIYYDGSHWIAIPHTERPYRQRRRRKRPEKSGELQQFEERFEKVKGGRKSRKAKLLQEFTSMFKDEDEAEQFIRFPKAYGRNFPLIAYEYALSPLFPS